MTVRELMSLLLMAENMDAKVYITNYEEEDIYPVDSIDEENEYNYGFVIGKVEF